MASPRNHLLTLLLPLALTGPLPASADNAFVTDPEAPTPSSVREGTRWQERATPPPPWPEEADLIEFELDQPHAGFRYFIDGRHLQVGSDDVVRYTLVAQAPSGARNLSFEGLRCTPRGTYKTYAYGAAGRFVLLDEPQWQPIGDHAHERFRQELWRHHFCVPRGFTPRPRKDMLRSLQGHIAPRQNSGFLTD
ncbi:CNP1-like family protein [Marichromatium bheemlicum]|uniref:CNP1-like uncharacterized domain-containing protein n=1 Tax=Marichromatium bheemlicum TaxID=365339 RepID=A0ABX1I5Z6_9GAMM|nr:CNP1-like family protein [Marichromatium bheemlicum]NKN31825.1 hypothetical protein [Marichromatium bheemlicum]